MGDPQPDSALPPRSREMTVAERDAFLAEVHLGVISVVTGEPDRGPLAVSNWYVYDPAEGVSIITARSSAKAQAIERAGRFTLVAQQEAIPCRYVAVEGPVVAARPPRAAEHEALVQRYYGTQVGGIYAAALGLDPDAHRYTMAPERWVTYTEAV